MSVVRDDDDYNNDTPRAYNEHPPRGLVQWWIVVSKEKSCHRFNPIGQ